MYSFFFLTCQWGGGKGCYLSILRSLVCDIYFLFAVRQAKLAAPSRQPVRRGMRSQHVAPPPIRQLGHKMGNGAGMLCGEVCPVTTRDSSSPYPTLPPHPRLPLSSLLRSPLLTFPSPPSSSSPPPLSSLLTFPNPPHQISDDILLSFNLPCFFNYFYLNSRRGGGGGGLIFNTPQ